MCRLRAGCAVSVTEGGIAAPAERTVGVMVEAHERTEPQVVKNQWVDERGNRHTEYRLVGTSLQRHLRKVAKEKYGIDVEEG